MRDQVVEQIATAKTTAMSYASSGAAVLVGGMTASELAALVGAACAVLTCFVNWWYRHQDFKREQVRNASRG